MARRRKKADSHVNTEGWMMSYADMATILLAMFIVLTTLGKDQTGASLQKGLESWRESRQFFGLESLHPTSAKMAQLSNPGPHYSDGRSSEGSKQPPGIDAETEQLQSFLGQLDRNFDLDKLPRVLGQATVDLFEPLNSAPPYLAAKHKEELWQILPVLQRGNYRVLLVVWATMAKETALTRAARQATAVADELARSVNLSPEARQRLIAVGQPWRYANFQRPVLSLIISKTEAVK